MENEISTYNIEFYNTESKEIIQQILTIQEGRHSESNNITWNCDFELAGNNLMIRNQYLLSGVMRKIREVIEPMGFRALVVCSEKNASHSGMQADMTNGTMIYKLTSNRNKKQYHVLSKSTIENVVSIQEQNDFIKDYYESRKKKLDIPWYRKIFR